MWLVIGLVIVMLVLLGFMLLEADDDRRRGLRDQMWIDLAYAGAVVVLLVVTVLAGLHFGWV